MSRDEVKFVKPGANVAFDPETPHIMDDKAGGVMVPLTYDTNEKRIKLVHGTVPIFCINSNNVPLGDIPYFTKTSVAYYVHKLFSSDSTIDHTPGSFRVPCTNSRSLKAQGKEQKDYMNKFLLSLIKLPAETVGDVKTEEELVVIELRYNSTDGVSIADVTSAAVYLDRIKKVSQDVFRDRSFDSTNKPGGDFDTASGIASETKSRIKTTYRKYNDYVVTMYGKHIRAIDRVAIFNAKQVEAKALLEKQRLEEEAKQKELEESRKVERKAT